MDDEQVTQLVEHLRTRGRDMFEQRADLYPGALESFLEEKASIEDGAAPIRDARRLNAIDLLPALDRVHVERRMTRQLGDDRQVGDAEGQRGDELAVERIEHVAHVLDGADPEKRHAAMRGSAVRRDLEPVNAAVTDADAV